MKISVLSPLQAKFLNQIENCCTWLTRTVLIEWSIWVYSSSIPSLNAFISPWIHTWTNQNIEFIGVLQRFSLQEKKCSLNSTRLITMNSSGHQNVPLILVPVASLHTNQRVPFLVQW
jgi:hypothetical protein